MSKRSDRELLLDILEAIDRIQLYVKELNYSEFLKSTLVQDAVVRNLEIIGEASKNISHDVKTNSSINWKKIAGMRDKLIHFYFGVNLDIVWSVIQEELPKLKSEIQLILENLSF